MQKNKYSKIEKKLGYKFSDINNLEQAFTHRSYRFEMKLDYDNKRTRESNELSAIENIENKTPLELFSELYEQQNNEKIY